MATKKTKRRKRSNLSSGGAGRGRRSVRRRRSKGGLSEMFSASTAKNSFKSVLASGGGGFAAVQANKIMGGMSKPIRLLIGVGLGFFGASMGAPSLSSGFTGGMIALNFQNGLLAEDDMADNAEFADENSLADMPLYLSESGEPMQMLPDGSFRYLEEDEVQALADAGVLEVVD